MRRAASIVAVAGFFLLAIVGYCSDVPPLYCGLRAMAGGAVLYVLTRFAGRLLVNIMVDEIVRQRSSGTEPNPPLRQSSGPRRG